MIEQFKDIKKEKLRKILTDLDQGKYLDNDGVDGALRDILNVLPLEGGSDE